MQYAPVVQKVKGLTGSVIRFFCISPRCLATYLVHGIIIIVPLAVTIWVIVWVFKLVDGMLAPVIVWGFGRPIPGLGAAIIVTAVVLVGYFGLKFGHRTVFDFFETQFIKIPVLGAIYGGTRQIIQSFTANSDASYKFLEVVFIEYPRKGIYTVGFVTSEAKSKDGKKILNVFIPTAPTPAGGFLQMVPESDVIRTTMSINDAMKLVISIGKVSHKDIADMLVQVPEPQNQDKVLKP